MQMAFMLKEIHMTIFFHLGVIGTIGFGVIATIDKARATFEVNIDVELFVVKFNILDQPWGIDAERLSK